MKRRMMTPEQAEEIRTKDFFDVILPGTIKFMPDHYLWATAIVVHGHCGATPWCMILILYLMSTDKLLFASVKTR